MSIGSSDWQCTKEPIKTVLTNCFKTCTIVIKINNKYSHK